MKIFLAPAFPLQRMCKHCERIAKKNDPNWWYWRHEVKPMPPLGRFSPETGFVPDYPVLLMFDEFIVDGEAFERIAASAPSPWLGTWPDVMRALEAEGSVTTVDMGNEAARVSRERTVMLRRDLRDPGRWRNAMAHYDSVIGGAEMAFGRSPDDSAVVDWEFNPERIGVVQGLDEHTHVPYGWLSAKEVDLDDIHRKVREAGLKQLRLQLSECNMELAVAKNLGAMPMLWAPFSRYLMDKTTPPQSAAADASRLFFEVAFPRFAPDTLNRFVELRSDRRLKSLRSEILRAFASGDVLDPSYPQSVLGEAMRFRESVGRVRKILGWVAIAAEVFPLPGSSVVAAAAGRVAERARSERHDWLYLISNGVGLS